MIWTKIEIMYLASYWLLYSYRPFFSKSAHQPVTEKKEKKEEGKTEIVMVKFIKFQLNASVPNNQ